MRAEQQVEQSRPAMRQTSDVDQHKRGLCHVVPQESGPSMGPEHFPPILTDRETGYQPGRERATPCPQLPGH